MYSNLCEHIKCSNIVAVLLFNRTFFLGKSMDQIYSQTGAKLRKGPRIPEIQLWPNYYMYVISLFKLEVNIILT